VIRVLNVASSPHALGGVESLLVRSAGELDPRAFDVSYCNLFFAHSTLVAALEERGVAVLAIGGRGVLGLPAVIGTLRRVIQHGAYDIVHTHMLHATIAGQAAASTTRAPVRIVTRHYTDHHIAAPLRYAERFLTRRATRVIAVSEAVRRHLVAIGVPDSRIRVVYNGIDVAGGDACRLEGALPWPADWSGRLLIASVGNLIDYKGQRTLIQAFARIRAENRDARLVLIGEGPERGALEGLARRLGVAADVAMPGHRTDVPALLRHCRIYVQPSRIEAFGIAAAEAMAASVPVVASNVEGLPELVRQGETGLLVPSQDADSMAEAVLALAGDTGRAAAMGAAGRKRIEREFTIQRHVAATADVYREAIAR
jgi:glycosyltransferase involved in cell wall biosynthesis